MTDKNTQIRNYKIKQFPKTDRQKLVGLRKFLREELHGVIVELEPYMLFTKGEDKFVCWKTFLGEDEVREYNVHPPDVILWLVGGEMMVLELDGQIHDIKVEKTNARNKKYELNNLLYVVVNETDLRFKLDIAKSALLPQDAINQEFLRKIKIRISQVKEQS